MQLLDKLGKKLRGGEQDERDWYGKNVRALADFARTMNDQVWKSEALSKRYLDGVRSAIPLAREQLDLILRVTRHALPGVNRFLDLGCGDGVLGRTVLAAFPDSAGVFLDFSEAMLKAAKEKLLSAAVSKTIFLCEDYGKPAWIERVRPYAPFDLILSGFSIHHQPDVRKRSLYHELYELLADGGLFLNLEHVASAAPWLEAAFDEYFVDALWRFHETSGQGTSIEKVAQEYYARPDKAANILALTELQCSWLREIGFEDVDCYFKALELALFGGVKPCGQSV